MLMGSKKKKDRLARKPKQSQTPRKGSAPSPSGPQKIPISEVDYLKFRITKLNEEILKLQDQKLAADEEVVKVTKENVGLRRRLTLAETQRTYDEVGIVSGDQVLPDGDGFVIVRPSGGVSPAPKKTPMEIVKEEDGKEDAPEGEKTPE